MVLYIGENWIFHAPPNPIHRGHRDSKKTFGGGPPSYPNPRSWSQWCFCFCGHQMCRLLQRLLTVFVRCPFGNSTWLRCLISPKYITKYIRDSCKMTVNVYFQLVNHIGFANGLQKNDCVIQHFYCWILTPLQSYDFVELWAGHALTSTCVRKSGRCTAALDITYFEPDPDHPDRSNHFDILTPSGFLLLAMAVKQVDQIILWTANILL